MRLISHGVAGACALVLMAACGGSGASISDAGDDGGRGGGDAADGASGESGGQGDGSGGTDGALDVGAEGGDGGGGDGGPSMAGTYCGPNLVCTGMQPQQGTICCVSTGGGMQYSCAAVECGCDTQLECARDANCQNGAMCCIGNRQDANCATGHYVATCQAACTNGQQHMCDPNAQQLQCANGQMCSSDTGGVNLPVTGFGVCL